MKKSSKTGFTGNESESNKMVGSLGSKNVTVKDIVKNLNQGNTVLFTITTIKTENFKLKGYIGIPITRKKGFVDILELKERRKIEDEEILNSTLQFICNCLNPEVSEEIKCIKYNISCLNHVISNDEFKQYESDLFKMMDYKKTMSILLSGGEFKPILFRRSV